MQRRDVHSHHACGRGVDRVLLALDGRTGARVHGGVALRHEPPHADGLPRRQQVIGAVGPQAVGQLEVAVGMPHVHRFGDRGQLVDDHVGLRPPHGLRDLIGIERLRDHRHGAQLLEHRPLGFAARQAMNLMARRDQPRHQRPPDRSRRSGYEHSHRQVLDRGSVAPHKTRKRSWL
ncbi:MAG TPA: hypothetical protein VH834_19845 [Solirubrobacteraceae bacterium]